MGSPFKGSNDVKTPGREGPRNGDCLEGGGWHVALICKELATDTMLDQVMCIGPLANRILYGRPFLQEPGLRHGDR